MAYDFCRLALCGRGRALPALRGGSTKGIVLPVGDEGLRPSQSRFLSVRAYPFRRCASFGVLTCGMAPSSMHERRKVRLALRRAIKTGGRTTRCEPVLLSKPALEARN
jgi:hypothetical protein